MLVCRFQSAVFDVQSESNFLTCLNNANTYFFCTLVNSHICGKCPLAEMHETDHRFIEPEIKPRPLEVVEQCFATSCSQCSDYQENTQCCYLMHNSKTIQEALKNPNMHCPRKLW